MVTGIDHVQVVAPPGAEAAAREFYGSFLGMAEISKPPLLAVSGGVWFQCGAQQVHIGIETGEFVAARKGHPAFLVDGLDAPVAGREVEWDERIPGVRRCYVWDPFGNRVELISASTAACLSPKRA